MDLLEYLSKAIQLRSLIDSNNVDFQRFTRRMSKANEDPLKNYHVAVACRVAKVARILLKTIAELTGDEDILYASYDLKDMILDWSME